MSIRSITLQCSTHKINSYRNGWQTFAIERVDFIFVGWVLCDKQESGLKKNSSRFFFLLSLWVNCHCRWNLCKLYKICKNLSKNWWCSHKISLVFVNYAVICELLSHFSRFLCISAYILEEIAVPKCTKWIIKRIFCFELVFYVRWTEKLDIDKLHGARNAVKWIESGQK